MKYNTFDIVLINKLHYNVFFTYANGKDKLINRLNSEKTMDWLFKQRPAIVIRRLTAKQSNPNDDKYLVIPMTTKRSIEGWKTGKTLMRIELKNNHLKGGKSYLMLDAILTLSESEIIGLYNNHGSRARLTQSQKNWLVKQLKSKYNSIFNVDCN